MNAFLPGFEQLALRDEAPGTTSGFKPGVVKGVDSTDTLAIRLNVEIQSSVYKMEHPAITLHREETTGGEVFTKGQRIIPLTSPKGVISNRTLSVRGIDFQVSTFVRSLSRLERATVARRPRFHSMPWIVPAGQDDTDQLP